MLTLFEVLLHLLLAALAASNVRWPEDTSKSLHMIVRGAKASREIFLRRLPWSWVNKNILDEREFLHVHKNKCAHKMDFLNNIKNYNMRKGIFLLWIQQNRIHVWKYFFMPWLQIKYHLVRAWGLRSSLMFFCLPRNWRNSQTVGTVQKKFKFFLVRCTTRSRIRVMFLDNYFLHRHSTLHTKDRSLFDSSFSSFWLVDHINPIITSLWTVIYSPQLGQQEWETK